MTKLFDHMYGVYGLTLIEDELRQIANAVHFDDAEQMRLAMGRDADSFGFYGLPTTTNPDPYKPEKNVSSDFGGMA